MQVLLDLLAVADRKLVFYDSGHKLPPEFATDAANWLRLKLELPRG